jgi:hypothetical protein
MIIGERPHDSSAGPASLHVLGETNSFIHKYFWLTVNFPAIARGIPNCLTYKDFHGTSLGRPHDYLPRS